MRHSLRIRVQFEPSRLSVGYLHSAYEMAVPIVRRAVNEQNVEGARESLVPERSRATAARISTRARTPK